MSNSERSLTASFFGTRLIEMNRVGIVGLLVSMLCFPVHDLLQQETRCIVNVAVILCRCPKPTIMQIINEMSGMILLAISELFCLFIFTRGKDNANLGVVRRLHAVCAVSYHFKKPLSSQNCSISSPSNPTDASSCKSIYQVLCIQEYKIAGALEYSTTRMKR